MKRFFLGMENELLIIKETDDGYSFSSHLKGTQPIRLAFDPQNEKRIYCATNGDGLWKSEDGGKDWTAIGKDNHSKNQSNEHNIQSSKVTAVAVHPIKRSNGNSIVYAGTEPSMLYYSEDNGKSWSEFKEIQALPSKSNWSFPPRPHTHFVRWITPGFSNENHIGVSIEAGAFIRTDDHGETWKDRPDKSPIDIHTLLAHPKSPGRLYAANGDGSSKPKHAYAESKDEGQHWEYLSEGTEDYPYLYHMVLNPDNPEDRLVSGSKSAAKAHGSSPYSTVYRKIEDKPWKEIAEGLPREGAFTHNLAADPTESAVFYALNNYGIYRLNTKGSHWSQLEINWKKDYLNQQPKCFAVKEE